MAITTYNATALTGGTTRALDSYSVASLNDGDRAFVATGGTLYYMVFDSTATDAESSPSVIRPDDYSTAGVWKQQSIGAPTFPEGTIVPYLPGYFTDGSNGGFTAVMATNNVTAINALLNPNWYVCDGSALNDASSTIFNGASRYLPNLTDDRFIMGDTAGGGTGGSSTMAHVHTISHIHSIYHDHGNFNSGSTTLSSTTHMPAHTHNTRTNAVGVNTTGTKNVLTTDSDGYLTASTGGSGSHYHSVNPPAYSGNSGGSSAANSGAASVTENRPKFLSCFYLMRVR